MSPTVPQKKRRTLVADTNEANTNDVLGGGEEILISRSDGSESEEELDIMDDEVQIEKAGIRNLNIRFPMIASRASPAALVNALKILNEKQMKEVKDMGFGHLVHLGIEKVPTRLAFWVVDNFDARRSEINIQDGRRLHIEAADVQCVLGFPNGGRAIVRKKKFEQSDILDAWLEIFGRHNRSIVAKDVAKEMLKHKNGGEVFRRHFVVLVIVCLIETSSNGYIAPQILGCLGDLTRVKEFDWCSYVIKSLVEHKIMWEKNKKKNFSGPMLFLTAFYVDRVVLYSRTVVREFPTIKNWTHLLMKNIENAEIKSGGFGGGYPREPISMMLEDNDASIPQNTPTDAKSNTNGGGGCVDTFGERFMQKAKLLAITMVEIIAMVEGAPQQLADATQLKKFLDASHQLLGPVNVGGPSTVEAPVQTQFINTQADDEFWGNPDMIAMIEQIETAMAKRNEFIKNLPDGPSFSLGLTQEGHAGLENENEYLDFSLMDDDAGDVQFVRSGRRSTGIVINDNGNADERICDKQRLENDRMEKQLYESLPGESDQANRRREIAKGKRKVQDVEHFGGYNSEISKETEFVEPLPHQMEKRNRATIKKTEKFMSPYVVRAVDISTKVSKNEKELWYWIFYNDEANNEDILFASDDVSINRGDMLTMRQNTMIRSNILDAWSSCFEIDDLNGSYDKKKLMGKFIRDFDCDLSKMKGIKLGKIELFVFPVYAMEHYQIVCFNVKTFRVDVIDDKVPSTIVDDSASCEAFSNYLRIKGMRAKAAALSKIEVATPDLPCRGKHKNSDCWIYTMRHMKTYMGEGVKNWKCGRSSCETLLKKMRIKYCAEILCADINVRKEYNTKEASFHYRASSGDGPINIDKLLRNN
ncbi:hypothetical protein C2S52_015566 [Perilla frutescens var. hirtella]|nr:hypothetical protein C2S52_015566 [Perilla frutescens var. hirtella]